MLHRVVVVALVAACTSPSSTGFEVLPGPEIVVKEGETSDDRFLRYDGAPLRREQVELEHPFADLVERDGELYLHVTPPCSTIANTTATVSETITLSLTDIEAEPVVVTVEVRPNEDGPCAVAIRAWPGPCADRQGAAPGQIELVGPAQILCLEATLPDSIPSIDVTFPTANSVDPLFLTAGGEAWTAMGPSSTREVTLERVHNLRGHLDFEITWRTEDAVEIAHFDLVHGQPGEGAIRVRGVPNSIDEYNTATFVFTTSYYDLPDTGSCVRATPQDASTTALVVRTGNPRVAEQGTLICNESIHTVELVMGLSAAPAEHVNLEMYRCSGCGDEPTAACCEDTGQLEPIDTQTATLTSRSLAEAVGDGSLSARACVDIDGDDRPEVVVADSTTTHLYAASGTVAEDVRFTTPVSIPSPTSTFALQWFDGVNVQPVLVGEFEEAPSLRVATTMGWDTKQWAALPVSPYGTDEWVPLGPRHGAGASYLVVQKLDSIFGFACVSPACTTDGPLIDVSSLGGGQIDSTIRGIGVADIDRDTDLDLLVAVEAIATAGNNRPLTLWAYDLQWQGHVLVSHSPPTQFETAQPQIDWNRLKFVALPRPGAPDSIYVLASSATRHAIVATVHSGTMWTSEVLGTIGNAFEIAAVDNALFAATDLGIWELEGTSWHQRDPERAILPASFPVPTESITYGRTLRACLMKPGARSSVLFDVESGARWTFADVVVETLPEP